MDLLLGDAGEVLRQGVPVETLLRVQKTVQIEEEEAGAAVLLEERAEEGEPFVVQEDVEPEVLGAAVAVDLQILEGRRQRLAEEKVIPRGLFVPEGGDSLAGEALLLKVLEEGVQVRGGQGLVEEAEPLHEDEEEPVREEVEGGGAAPSRRQGLKGETVVLGGGKA